MVERLLEQQDLDPQIERNSLLTPTEANLLPELDFACPKPEIGALGLSSQIPTVPTESPRFSEIADITTTENIQTVIPEEVLDLIPNIEEVTAVLDLSNPLNPEEILLVEKAITGDKESFSLLCENNYDRIFQYIAKRVLPEYAEDLTQEVFRKATGAISRFENRNVPFSTWLFRIAHNCISNYYRQQKQRERVSYLSVVTNVVDSRQPDPEIVILGSLTQSERSQKLRLAIQRLSPNQQAVIELHLTGLTPEQISIALNKKQATVGVLMYRGRKILRRLLDKEDFFDPAD